MKVTKLDDGKSYRMVAFPIDAWQRGIVKLAQKIARLPEEGVSLRSCNLGSRGMLIDFRANKKFPDQKRTHQRSHRFHCSERGEMPDARKLRMKGGRISGKRPGERRRFRRRSDEVLRMQKRVQNGSARINQKYICF